MGAFEAPQPSPLASDTGDRTRGSLAQALRRLRRQPVTVAALVVLAGLFIAGGLAPVIAPGGANKIDLAARWRNHPPTLAGGHLLGTDNVGHDILVRTLYGIHTSEQSALLAALLATLLGVAMGCLAGYAGGWLDAFLMRTADLVVAFPALMVLYAAWVFSEPVTIRKATFIFGFYLWTSVARAVRAAFVSLRNVEFVQAAQAAGASSVRIVWRHILPNAAGAVLVAASAVVGLVLMLEATVEFFGLGVSSVVQPSLGNLIGDAAGSGIGTYNELGLGWWVWASPAFALVAIIVCVNLVGDGLDTALNPGVAER